MTKRVSADILIQNNKPKDWDIGLLEIPGSVEDYQPTTHPLGFGTDGRGSPREWLLHLSIHCMNACLILLCSVIISIKGSAGQNTNVSALIYMKVPTKTIL